MNPIPNYSSIKTVSQNIVHTSNIQLVAKNMDRFTKRITQQKSKFCLESPRRKSITLSKFFLKEKKQHGKAPLIFLHEIIQRKEKKRVNNRKIVISCRLKNT